MGVSSPTATEDPAATATRRWSASAAAAAAAAGAVAFVWLLIRQPLAERLEQGLTVWWFGTTVPTFRGDPAAITDRFGHVLMLFAAVLSFITVRHRGFWRQFLLAPGSPIDLAVLRVVVFGVLAVLPRVREAVEVSALPAELRTPPAGMPWLLDLLPGVTPSVIAPLAIMFVLACLLACAGLWTRWASAVAVVLGLFVLAVPQSYGKVTHFHHLWWIAAVLAASRCGDALSLDEARRAWRQGNGTVTRPAAAAAYGLPVRLTWLLIAGTYLFPGVWKYASAGWGWAFSDNVRTILYEHWTRLEGFTPLVPIDRWPLAYRLGGLAVIVLEISFPLLVLGRHTRPLAAVAGLAFHNANFLFLRLSFATLQVTYLSFVPWSRVFSWLGDRLPEVRVEARTQRQLQRLGALRALDPMGLVQPRATPAAESAGPHHPTAMSPHRRGIGAVAAMAVLIGSANTLAGLGGVTAAWPFACYPTFAGIARTTRPEPLLVLDHPDGSRREIVAAELRRRVSWEGLDALARPILNRAPDARRRGAALVDAAEAGGLDIPPGTTISFYRTDAALGPPGAPPPDDRVLLFTIER